MERAIRADDMHQSEFIDAIHTIVPSLVPVFERKPSHALIMAQMLEPEKAFEFRVPWTDDAGLSRVNRGYRVQYSSTLGPYMGGLRFQKELSHSTVKSLAFDNIFSNALCGTIGAAAGGSDFDPRNKSEAEIMRFCQSFMTGMVANVGVGAGRDLPGVGIGVGKREVSYLYGQYKRITHMADSQLLWGGNQVFPEATGYGVAHFANHILKARGESLEGARCLITGTGNVALNLAKKLAKLGARSVTLSDSSGYVYLPSGLNTRQIGRLMKIRDDHENGFRTQDMNWAKGGPADLNLLESTKFGPLQDIWDVKCDYAFPCATQNELGADAARRLVENGCKAVFEGASMPCTSEAIGILKQGRVLFGPNKAVNAGGVSTPGLLAKAQRRMMEEDFEDENGVVSVARQDFYDSEVDQFMQRIGNRILRTCDQFRLGSDLEAGANIYGFLKVANAMTRQGSV
jgi:glutamate dehydrogenase (NADP+)